MKRLLCSIALAGFACAASAHLADTGGSARTFAGQDGPLAHQSPSAGTHSFNDLLAETSAGTSRTESRIAAAVAPSIPEPQTYALLLAGLGAIVFVAVRRGSRP